MNGFGRLVILLAVAAGTIPGQVSAQELSAEDCFELLSEAQLFVEAGFEAGLCLEELSSAELEWLAGEEPNSSDRKHPDSGDRAPVRRGSVGAMDLIDIFNRESSLRLLD